MSQDEWALQQANVFQSAYDELAEMNNNPNPQEYDIGMAGQMAAGAPPDEEMLRMADEILNLQDSLTQKDTEIQRLKQLVETEKRKAEQERGSNKDQDKQVQQLQQAKSEAERRADQHKADLERAQREKDELKRTSERRIQDLEERAKRAEQDREQAIQKLKNVEKERDSVQEQYRALVSQTDNFKHQTKEQEEKARKAQEVLERATREKEELERRSKSDAGKFEQEVTDKLKEVGKLRSDYEKALHDLSAAKALAEEHERKLKEVQKREKELLEEKNRHEADIAMIQKKENEIKQKFLQNEIKKAAESLKPRQRNMCHVDENGERQCNVSRCSIM